MTKIKVAIIGTRNMGAKHLAVLREFFDNKVEVCGILNSTPQSSKQRAQELGTSYFNNIDEISADNTDAVIISSPANCHLEHGINILDKGIDCLLEKPMAMDEDECKELINAKEKSGAILMIGHTENYNPAVIALKEVIDCPIKTIKAFRSSDGVNKERTTNIFPELAIHDLAIISSLVPQKLLSYDVTKDSKYKWSEHGIANLVYEDDVRVEVEALVANIERRRTMEIEDIKGNKFYLDCLNRKLLKNGELLFDGGNALKNELECFVNGVIDKDKSIDNSEEGLKNVALCSKLEQLCG